MGSFSIWHWVIVLLVVLLLFGSGKISGLMGDFAKGIKSFKQNIKEDERPADAAMTAESAPPAAPLGIVLSPASGPNGTDVTVTGTGFAPGTEVEVVYLDTVGEPTGSSATTTTDAQGAFTTTVTAQDPANLPGRHTVRASDGASTAEAGFDAQA